MKIFLLFILLLSFNSYAQETEGTSLKQVQQMIDESLSSKWYERIRLRGYAQFRYNRLAESNSDYSCTTCDRSIGDKQGFFLRRARLTIQGMASDRVFFSIQPDYATDAVNQNYFQIRDAFFDYFVTQNAEWRIRTGLSKVPFGFTNLQSSSMRGPLDRDDALNTGVPNERDIGLSLIYTPSEIRKRFVELGDLKGSGDYGIFDFSVYNGQGPNKSEKNNDLHRVIRLTYPFKLASGQIIETSLQAYEGQFFVEGPNKDFYDARQAASLIFYPQPFGFQAEYNIGTGPEYSPSSNKVENQNLNGGYAMINYSIIHNDQRFFPYLRYQVYDGGRKVEGGALSKVREWEIGTEWQPDKAIELTAAFAQSDRLIQSSATNRTSEEGHLVRLQAQLNY